MSDDLAPIKVLFILPSLTAGGAERVMITLMNGLDKNRFSPFFLTVSDKGDLKDLIDPTLPFASLHTDSVLRALPKLYAQIKKTQPDIVISTMAHMNFCVLSLKPFFPAVKFIVREAITPSFLFQKYKGTSFLIKALYKYLYPKADIVLSPSQIIFDEFRDLLRMESKNFKVLPNPVDVKSIDHGARDLSKAKDTVYFLAAGRLGKQKGFDRLIEYLPTIRLPYKWNLTILGEGDERQNLESLIRKNNFTDIINMPGLVRPPWPYYCQADCFLMSSRFEGLPNVVLESLACGTPVIATRESGGIKTIAENAPQKAVTIVDDMMSFITEMEKIKPSSAKRKKSLLPDKFQQEKVTLELSALLEHI